jgi:hypothetical protein
MTPRSWQDAPWLGSKSSNGEKIYQYELNLTFSDNSTNLRVGHQITKKTRILLFFKNGWELSKKIVLVFVSSKWFSRKMDFYGSLAKSKISPNFVANWDFQVEFS